MNKLKDACIRVLVYQSSKLIYNHYADRFTEGVINRYKPHFTAAKTKIRKLLKK